VTLDALLLVAGGLLAILGGGAVLLFARERYTSLLAAAALGSLGLLQLGWARAIYDILEREVWFELSIAFALPVSLLWLLLSRALCREPGSVDSGVWRVYIVVQALCAVAALAFVTITPTWTSTYLLRGAILFPLRLAAAVMVAGILLNLTLAAASFESTYLSLPPDARRAFRPGLFSILIAAAYYGYTSISSLRWGSISAADISLGWVPVSALGLLLPFSLIRGRITELRVRRKIRPVTQTTSLALSIGFFLVTLALIWLMHTTRWSLARGLWVLFASGAALGIVALSFSSRVGRRAQRFIDPILSAPRIDRREISALAGGAAGGASNLAELCRIIPSNVREVAGTDPVTLFLIDPRDSRFIVMASTLDPAPTVVVHATEPLASELDRTRRAIHLRGRPDDLEYIPIYVENAAQITACAALCAAPILIEDELSGFVLCGTQEKARSRERPLLPILDIVCRQYSARFEALRSEGA
jgi:hypothetical protein